MTERLLQFIWRHQYFNKNELQTVDGEPLQILSQGIYNSDQGPDFKQGRIRIANTSWAGNIELHVRTSDWNRHQHEKDANYENVICHVVWEHDSSINNIPVLELKGRVAQILLKRYEELLLAPSFIPCEKLIHTVNELTWKSWKDRLLAERLERKAKKLQTLITESNQHWEEVCWRMLAKNFGAKVNGPAFEEMAASIPLATMMKHRSQIHQLEALLFGQAGLLTQKLNDQYYLLLQKEYRFLRDKYQLRRIPQPVHFLRMRPGNFPTVRIAQLAMLIHQSENLFSSIRDLENTADIKTLFDVTANDYWKYHYRFGEESSFLEKKLGADMIGNIVINTIAPLLFAHGMYHNEEKFKAKALKWLMETEAEINSVTKGFQAKGVTNNHAFDSQALIELKTEYCNALRCLDCGIGNGILNVK